jgi:hypothetical protein
MTDTISTRQYALQRIGRRMWLVEDVQHPLRATQPLGRVTLTEDDQVEVSWDEHVPLPVLYATLDDVLESLEEWAHRPRGATKPIPIPHYPPQAH